MRGKKKKRVRFILYLVAVFLSVGGALYWLRITDYGFNPQSTIPNQQSAIHNPISPRSIKQPQPTPNELRVASYELWVKPAIRNSQSVTRPQDVDLPLARDKISYLVIVVDDLGGNTAGTNKILSLNYPLTLAVFPHLPRSREVAEEAHRQGFEVIVHLPLEAEDEKYNKKNKPIMVDMLDSEIQEKTKDAFMSIPHSVGFNHHQGSKFTTSISALRNILKVAKENDFFYIDSLTSPHAVGELVAEGVGVKFGKRDIFLDNVKDKNYIKEQFGQLINIAKRKGSAVGICHVSSLTYEVLREELPRLSEVNIKLVFASEVVK